MQMSTSTFSRRKEKKSRTKTLFDSYRVGVEFPFLETNDSQRK